MGTFNEHIQQSKNNIDFLSKINQNIDNCWDWQVTVCFYSALHLINAHIVHKTNANYLSHTKVDHIINPFNTMSVARLNDDIYMSYTKLFQLSRRSRYLLSDDFKKYSPLEVQPGKSTYSKHLKKAIHHLEIIVNFINKDYTQSFSKVDIKCIDLKGLLFNNFTITS